MTDTKASIRRAFIKEYEARHLRVPLFSCRNIFLRLFAGMIDAVLIMIIIVIRTDTVIDAGAIGGIEECRAGAK